MFECVVVGAGPAGLASSRALGARGIDHVVLERGRAGQTWRTQRWDTLRLNNPGWMNPMLGEQPRDTYLATTEVVERLSVLALTSPVLEGVRVTRLLRDGDSWRLRTDDTEILARTVVVATGGENVPRLLDLAGGVSGRIAQYHAANYRNSRSLPKGGVLVVGSAQSGSQITEDLLAGGRPVVLATSLVGRIPARHRGRDTVEWLVRCGFFDQKRRDLSDPSVMAAPQPLIAPQGRNVGLQSLGRAGARIAGRLVDVDGERVRFDDSALPNIAAADSFADRIRRMLDDMTVPGGRHAVAVEADPAAVQLDAGQLVPPVVLDLRSAGVRSVIWCTGYTGDFSWLPPGLIDAGGRPRHEDGAAPYPGVWYVGLRWLTHRASGNFLGFPTDAAKAADAVVGHLEARPAVSGSKTTSPRPAEIPDAR